MWRMNLLILNLHNLDSLYCPLYWQGKSIFEPLHDKTNKMACAPSEDSDQPGHPPSRISLHCAYWVGKDPSFLQADSEDSDKTGRMPRLTCPRWAHMPFCWFCDNAAHFISTGNMYCPIPISQKHVLHLHKTSNSLTK